MKKLKLFVLLFLIAFVNATTVAPTHPTSWAYIGAPTNGAGTPDQSIDNSVGDSSTWWKFTSNYYEGADFILPVSGGITLQSVTITAYSTGHKDFVIKRSDGSYAVVYSLGQQDPAAPSAGTIYGSNFLQNDGKIIIGVRNVGPTYFHYLNDIAVGYTYSPAVCGDGFCNAGETPATCPQDCPGTCGDGYCNSVAGETCASCSADCPCCGGLGQACCSGGSCNSGLSCIGGSCVSSGGSLQQNYGAPAQEGDAYVASPVNWAVSVSGTGSGTCVYSALPNDRTGDVLVLDSNDEVQSASVLANQVSWSCDFSGGNYYNIKYSTPAPLLNEYGWTQDFSKQSTIFGQYFVQTEGVKNPSNEGYLRVKGDYSCFDAFDCGATSFELPSLAAGAEANASVYASGNAITVSTGDTLGDFHVRYLNATSSLSSIDLKNVLANAFVLAGLSYSLFWWNGGAFENVSGNPAFSFSVSNGNALWLIPSFSTQQFYLSAERKNAGAPCSVDQECKSNECVNGSCLGSIPTVSPSPLPTYSPTPSPTPTLGGDYNPVASPTPSPTPSPSPSPSVTPSPSSSPSPTASPSPTLAPTPTVLTVDIRVPDEFEVGVQKIFVYVNGEPANGNLQISDDGGRSFTTPLERDGSNEFFFDKEGFWKISFWNETKTVKAIKKNSVQPVTSTAANNLGGEEAQQITGFSIAGLLVVPWEYLLLFLLLLLLLAFIAYKKFYAVVRVKKSFDGKRVRIEVTNRFGDLKNVLLTDVVPEEFAASDYTEQPSVTETVTGNSLKWKKPALGKGSAWVIEYAVKTQGKPFESKRVELYAEDAKGRSVTAFS